MNKRAVGLRKTRWPTLATGSGFPGLHEAPPPLPMKKMAGPTNPNAPSRKKPSAPVRLKSPTSSVTPTPAASRRRILLVDDDCTVRDSLDAVLASEGYAVIQAENGQQALDLADTSAPDLVLLDLNMPVKNGWDTFEELTREHPFLPVIIVTARPNQFFTALGAGAGALLEKPMDMKALLHSIDKLLSESDEVRLKRLSGRSADFYYNAGQTEPYPDGDADDPNPSMTRNA